MRIRSGPLGRPALRKFDPLPTFKIGLMNRRKARKSVLKLNEVAPGMDIPATGRSLRSAGIPVGYRRGQWELRPRCEEPGELVLSDLRVSELSRLGMPASGIRPRSK